MIHFPFAAEVNLYQITFDSGVSTSGSELDGRFILCSNGFHSSNGFSAQRDDERLTGPVHPLELSDAVGLEVRN